MMGEGGGDFIQICFSNENHYFLLLEKELKNPKCHDDSLHLKLYYVISKNISKNSFVINFNKDYYVLN